MSEKPKHFIIIFLSSSFYGNFHKWYALVTYKKKGIILSRFHFTSFNLVFMLPSSFLLAFFCELLYKVEKGKHCNINSENGIIYLLLWIAILYLLIYK